MLQPMALIPGHAHLMECSFKKEPITKLCQAPCLLAPLQAKALTVSPTIQLSSSVPAQHSSIQGRTDSDIPALLEPTHHPHRHVAFLLCQLERRSKSDFSPCSGESAASQLCSRNQFAHDFEIRVHHLGIEVEIALPRLVRIQYCCRIQHLVSTPS